MAGKDVFDLFVKDFENKTITLRVTRHTTISQIKQLLEPLSGIPTADQSQVGVP
jgi:hypothetical protein